MTDEEKTIRRGIALTEDQWRLVKARAATEGQTISEFISDLIEYAPSKNALLALKDGKPNHALRVAPAGNVFDPTADLAARPITPAPKPGKKR